MKEKTKKALNITANIATWVVVVIAVLMVILTMLSFFGAIGGEEKDSKGIFGIKPYVVLSGSMDRVFPAGSLIFVEDIEDYQSLQVGDIITFKADFNSNTTTKDTIVTHQIVDILVSKDANGNDYISGFFTKGTENDDRDPVIYQERFEKQILGKYVGHVGVVGYVINFLQSKLGFFLLIAIPLLLIIAFQMKNIIVVIRDIKREKKEVQMNETMAINAELEEARRVKAELEALKAQMAQQQPSQVGEGGPLAVDEVQSEPPVVEQDAPPTEE